MRKSHAHNVMSSQKCEYPGCNKFIKLRLAEEKASCPLCYEHHCIKEAGRGHTLNTQARKKRVLADLPVKNFSKGG